jgi:hypothetical protein
MGPITVESSCSLAMKFERKPNSWSTVKIVSHTNRRGGQTHIGMSRFQLDQCRTWSRTQALRRYGMYHSHKQYMVTKKMYLIFHNLPFPFLFFLFSPRCSSVQSSRAPFGTPADPAPLFKIFPLRYISPYLSNHPTLHRFTSHDNIANFLALRNFFVDPSSGTSIHIDQVKDIDPTVVYDLVGPDWTHRQKGLSRDQVIDKAFEDKVVLALKAILEKEDLGFIELPRVLKDKGRTSPSGKQFFSRQMVV